MRRTGRKPDQPVSERLATLLAGDLPGYRLERRPDGKISFIPEREGPTLDVSSNIERRSLGRTEIAVFTVDYPTSAGDGIRLEARHAGRLKRSGLTIEDRSDGGDGGNLADEIAQDPAFVAAALPLDFTRFSLSGNARSVRACVELMGASHVAIAFPPMRSYVRLYSDQREALVASFVELGRLIRAI